MANDKSGSRPPDTEKVIPPVAPSPLERRTASKGPITFRKSRLDAPIVKSPDHTKERIISQLSTLRRDDDVGRGLICLRWGAFTWATEYFAKALYSDRNNLGARYGYGLSLFGNMDYGNALSVFARLAKAHPDDAFAHYWLGRINSELHNRDESVSEYATAFKLDPEIAALHKHDVYTKYPMPFLGGTPLVGRNLRDTGLQWPSLLRSRLTIALGHLPQEEGHVETEKQPISDVTISLPESC